MKLFRRKKNLKDAYESEKKSDKSGNYKIHIYEAFGKTPKKIKSFTAKRWVDEDDLIPYLRYKDPETDKLWLEIFPEQVKDFVHESEKQIEDKLKKVRTKLVEERKKKEPTVNFKDLEYEIMKLDAKLRTFKFSRDSSYVSLNEYSEPEFFYKREGSNYVPFKWDLDTSSIYTPSDNKKKSATIALRNKENKYPTTPASHKVLGLIFLAILMIGAVGFGYLTYKSVDQYSDSEINNAIEACVQDYAGMVSNTRKQTEDISEITELLKEEINKEPTIVQGRDSRSFE